MKQFHLNTNQLYIVSAHVLRDFVLLLKERKQTKDQHKLIHEKVLITNLLDTLAEGRDKRLVNKKSKSSTTVEYL